MPTFEDHVGGAAAIERSSATTRNGDGPRRSSLAQERSRRTRKKLVAAAVKLWTERGFDNGVETTTVAEIARVAGVTKGTFYFHFAHKEDVLLEMSFLTSRAVSAAALEAAALGATIDDILLHALSEMARRTEQLPRAAIARTAREFYQYSIRRDALATTLGVFPELFAEAQARREIPACIDPTHLADMMSALVLNAVVGWCSGGHDELAPILAYRARVLLSGVRAEHTH